MDKKIKFIYPPQDPKYPESYHFYRGCYSMITDNSEEADFFFYIIDVRVYLNDGEGPHLYPLLEIMKHEHYHSKIVIIDYSDPPEIRYIPKEIYMKVGWYFKRSMVNREMITYDRDVIPIYYGVGEGYVALDKELSDEYEFDVSCMFGDNLPEGGNRAGARDLVKKIKDNVFVGTVYDDSYEHRYGKANKKYYEIMKKSKIIVTANPNGWEGDFRLSEALYTGNLVLCDKMVNPPPGLEHRKNILWYSSMTELEFLLSIYLSDELKEEREQIGLNGRAWAEENCFLNVVHCMLNTITLEKRSSYNSTLTFGDFLNGLLFITKPKKVIEFGILDGYSLEYFAKTEATVVGYDIFEEFNGKSPPANIKKRFEKYKNVIIEYGDFYNKYTEIPICSVDIIHIDIANNGDVYRFAVEHYLPLIRKDGFLILEGGSKRRDKVEWMEKYQKQPIQTYLKSLGNDKYKIIGTFPSITIIPKND